MCRPYILCDAHAVRTCLWYHLWVKFRALSGSVWGAEQLVVFWLADTAHFAASVPSARSPSHLKEGPLTPRRPPHCWGNSAHTDRTTPPRAEEWDVWGRCGLQPPRMCALYSLKHGRLLWSNSSDDIKKTDFYFITPLHILHAEQAARTTVTSWCHHRPGCVLSFAARAATAIIHQPEL